MTESPVSPPPQISPPPLVSVEALSVSFPGRSRPAVDDVAFELSRGECVALVGESGSGKTLTGRALLGLLPKYSSVSGRMLLCGEPAPRPGSNEWNEVRGSFAALVPQNALGGLDPLRRIEHEVGDALRLHRLAAGSERRGRVLGALSDAGMPDPELQLRRRSDELSGGLRQRALVASALIADPRLIVADEPTTALDAVHRSRVMSELRRRTDLGATVLLISHDLASVREVADRVLVMREGRLVEQGTTSAVFDAPRHPFTLELLAASPSGRARGTRLLPATAPASSAAPAPHPSDTPGSPPRLELRGVSLAFGRGSARREILHDASFTVPAGKTVGLVGESGAGKTTLLRIALGLLTPATGTVLIDGVDRSTANGEARRTMRRRIAFVPQDPLDAFPRGASGVAILVDALRAAGIARHDRISRAATLAEEVGLEPDLLGRSAALLSGGQRQRLAIARALARGPELLMLDEPVSALDVTVQARVLDLLDHLQERHGTAYLLVSHDTDVIAHMSDQVLRLRAGSLTPSPAP